MVSILRQHFGAYERLTVSRSTFKWDSDPVKSKCVIDVSDNKDFKTGDKFPKFLVDLETEGYSKDFIGDEDHYDMAGGSIGYTVRTESAYSIECMSIEKLESRAMADEARLFLHTYRRHIACKYGYHYLRPAQTIKPVKSVLYDQYWITRLIVSFEITDSWKTEEEALRASAISLNLHAE